MCLSIIFSQIMFSDKDASLKPSINLAVWENLLNFLSYLGWLLVLLCLIWKKTQSLLLQQYFCHPNEAFSTNCAGRILWKQAISLFLKSTSLFKKSVNHWSKSFGEHLQRVGSWGFEEAQSIFLELGIKKEEL